MGEDNLEKFIRGNRDAFDDRSPSGKVWNHINSRLNANVKYNHWWKAAAVIFFCCTIALLINNFKPTAHNSDLAELEEFYISQIDYKKSLVNNLRSDKATFNNIDQELQKLDAMYMVLKDEWNRKPSKEVLEALTLNLLVRLDLLNGHLKNINQASGEKPGTSI